MREGHVAENSTKRDSQISKIWTLFRMLLQDTLHMLVFALVLFWGRGRSQIWFHGDGIKMSQEGITRIVLGAEPSRIDQEHDGWIMSKVLVSLGNLVAKCNDG